MGKVGSYPIQDQDFPNIELLLKQSCSDRDRVEEAEAHGLVGFGVMSRRSYNGETVLNVAHCGLKSQIDDAADGHSGSWRGIQFIPRGVGIDAYSTARQPYETLDGQLREFRYVQLLPIHRIRSCAKHILHFGRGGVARNNRGEGEQGIEGSWMILLNNFPFDGKEMMDRWEEGKERKGEKYIYM